MSAEVLEVSEGIPQDGRIFQPPPVNEDNTRPRYVTFLGSLIDPETVTSRPWTRGGGMELSNPCLRYVKNFLRKGRITPVLRDTHDFQPYDLVKKTTDMDPLGAGYFGQPIPQGYQPPALPPANGQMNHGFGSLHIGGPSAYGNMVGRLALPGEQINRILTGDENLTHTNMRRGIVEFKSLVGHDYRPEQIGAAYVDPTIWQIQKTIFPDYPRLPVLLDETEALLDAATVHASLRAIVDEMTESLIQFRDYASSTIQNTHANMKDAAVAAGYVYRYTAMDLVLLEQLGMARQDRDIKRATTGADSELREMFTAWMRSQVEEKEALTAMHKAQTPDQNTMAAAAIAEPAPAPEPETVAHACECGKSFPTPQGLSMHRTRHCELRKAEEVAAAKS